MREAIVSHLDSRQVSRVLYGSIIGLALVVALEAHPPRSVAIVVSLVATALAVGLAEVYADYVGTEVRTRTRPSRHRLAEMFEEAGATATGVAFPGVFFALAALGVMERDTAFAVAKWSGLGLILTYAFAAARLTGDTLVNSLRRAAVAGLIGTFLIVIKALLH